MSFHGSFHIKKVVSLVPNANKVPSRSPVASSDSLCGLALTIQCVSGKQLWCSDSSGYHFFILERVLSIISLLWALLQTFFLFHPEE